MTKKQKLELTWIGKDVRPKLEPRILLEDPELSFHAEARVSENDIFDNLLIHGDNLLALKALEQEYAGKVKCIYIDPPYNTGSAFEHYDDGVEHSLWLSLMRDRLELLHRLLRDDGSLWVNLDDNEAHYFKVMCDEVFGRKNFIEHIIWIKRVSPANDAKFFSSDHDSIFLYAKNKNMWSLNRLERTELQNSYYKNPDKDIRGAWNSITYTGNKNKQERPNLYYPIKNPNTGKIIYPPETLTWRYGQDKHAENEKLNLLYWGKDGKSNVPRLKMFLSDAEPVVPRNVWPASEVGSTQTSMVEQKALAAIPFGTPKPELLLQRVLHIATNPGDLVLDSFLGSGTTAAVAHKMGRRWIGIELGEHCYTHCIPRLQKVIKGEDLGGITKAIDWQGGGGFRFYCLGPSLIRADAWGNPVINPEFNPEMLAEALCKLENFTYAPSPDTFWIHGQSSERDFIYVTTQFLTQDMLAHIAAELTPERSLLVCCGAYSATPDAFPNITLKKIPKAVLDKCEWGHDDYSLAVENLPKAEASPATIGSADDVKRVTEQSTWIKQQSLFDI